MQSIRKLDIVLFLLFFLFSSWLMSKSFRYVPASHEFLIARNQVGDFGLHISLIRSFSKGDNFPVEHPYFPGKPLPYHYFTDMVIGLLERAGIRIDIAMNGVSTIAFSVLLYLIYRLPQSVFRSSRKTGLLSVFLFLFHSGLTFLDFFKSKPFSSGLIRTFWTLPDYIHKGPFDGSVISTYFTLNVFLNQRHLIVGMMMDLFIIYMLLQGILNVRRLSRSTLIALGILLGIACRVHSLLFFGTVIEIFTMLVVFRHTKWLFSIFVPAAFSVGLLTPALLLEHSYRLIFPSFNPGFLVERPLTLGRVLWFWFANTGPVFLLLPFAVFTSKKKYKLFFLSVLPLFVLPNLFQLSFRLEHNHSLINYFLLFADIFIAVYLVNLWRGRRVINVVVVIIVFFLTASGMIDLMAIKNDYQYPVKDAPTDHFIAWVEARTPKRAVFLSRQELYDPVTLAGRRNYFGHTYYTSVMGYPPEERERQVKTFFEAHDISTIEEIRKSGINFVSIPAKKVTDFNYSIDEDFFSKNLERVYVDEAVHVYKL